MIRTLQTTEERENILKHRRALYSLRIKFDDDFRDKQQMVKRRYHKKVRERMTRDPAFRQEQLAKRRMRQVAQRRETQSPNQPTQDQNDSITKYINSFLLTN